MRSNYKLFASVAAIAVCGAASQASAQLLAPPLTPSDPTTEVVSTATTVTFDEETGVSTSVTEVEEAVSVEYSAEDLDYAYGSFGGQNVSGAYSYSATASFNQVTETTTTATPDGAGGFTVSDPVTGDPVVTSDTVVANVSGYTTISTDITGMLSETLTVSTGENGTQYNLDYGEVSTDGTFYYAASGSAAFNPETGEIEYDDFDTLQYTSMGAGGVSSVLYTNDGSEVQVAAMSGAGFVAYAASEEDGISGFASLNSGGVSVASYSEETDTTQLTGLTSEGLLVAATTGEDGEEQFTAVTSAGIITTGEIVAPTVITDDVILGGNSLVETIANLEAADVALGDRITTESAARVAADTALDTRITTESNTRAAADTALGNRITAESNARAAADLAETNARIAADNALGARITAEADARIAADNVLRDQIASSTATAIALGGNAILPDTNFTLSGNVGFYQGAQAVSINAAGRVADKVYITGAVGGGLNKRGKLGGRVGVVFGF